MASTPAVHYQHTEAAEVSKLMTHGAHRGSAHFVQPLPLVKETVYVYSCTMHPHASAIYSKNGPVWTFCVLAKRKLHETSASHSQEDPTYEYTPVVCSQWAHLLHRMLFKNTRKEFAGKFIVRKFLGHNEKERYL